jgi:ribose-phosphate pyrophosphokinase
MSSKTISLAEVQALVRQAFQTGERRPIKIFGLNGTKAFAEKVASHLDMELTPHTEKTFDDDECYIKPADGDIGNVRGHRVFVIQSLYSDAQERVADKFMKLCVMCGALKHASAYEVIPVIPHLAWARQDRKMESRAPITTKIVARMLEATGIARVLLMDVHNLAAEQNAFDVPMDNLESQILHAQWCAAALKRRSNQRRVAVLSPDSGGVHRATRFRNILARLLGMRNHEIDVVIFDKVRDPKTGETSGGRIIGNVAETDVIAVDDMISTAGTIVKAGAAVPEFGGTLAAVCATHGLFVGNANEKLPQLECPIVVSDTVDPWRLTPQNAEKLVVINTSRMFSDAILRIHTETGSISKLLELDKD